MENAIDIIEESNRMHPSLLTESLEKRAWDDANYAATRESAAIKKSVLASFEATHRAIDAINADNVESLKHDMGAGIIALNVACRLLCLPPHVRTQAAIQTWESE
jgi:hypothetical protein